MQMLAYVFEASKAPNPAKHIVLPFVLSGLPHISYVVIFWTCFAAALFWFACMLILLIYARKSYDLHSGFHAFFLDLLVTVLFPLLANALYLIILQELFGAFACEYAPHSATMTLIADPHIECWKQEHFILMGFSFLALCLYLPMVLRALPMSQAMKEHYDGYRNHIVYLPKYLVFEAEVKVLITITKTFFRAQWAHLSALGVCMLMLLALQVYYKPCVSSQKVNLWRVVGYIFILCAVGSGVIAIQLPNDSYISFIVLGASWIVVLFFAVFVHRAMFHTQNILAKYRSIRVDVNRQYSLSEQTPLIQPVKN